jgi:hypothetical protein
MRGMVFHGMSSSKGEALHVRGRSKHKSSNDNNNHDTSCSNTNHLRSYVSTARRKKLILLRIVGSCKIRRRRKYLMVTVVSGVENSDSKDCLVVFTGCVSYL